MSAGSGVPALRAPEQLYDLLAPGLTWSSVGVDSNVGANGEGEATACSADGLARGPSGRFELLGEGGGFAVAHPAAEPPERARELCRLLHFRNGPTGERRDYPNAEAASRVRRERASAQSVEPPLGEPAPTRDTASSARWRP